MNVYIASLPRSGTTLLGIILNQHPQCTCIGESYYWRNYQPGTSICSCGHTNCHILNEVHAKISSEKTVLSFCDTCIKLDANLLNGASYSIDNSSLVTAEAGLTKLMDVYRAVTANPIIIDTSTNVTLGKYLALSNDYKVILLTRDPRGVLYSFKKALRRYGRSRPLIIYASSFLAFAQAAFELIQRRNVLWATYEDMCSNPEYEMRRICRFLRITHNPLMIDLSKVTHHLVMGNRIRNLHTLQITEDIEWKASLDEQELDILRLNKKIVELYSKLNYTF